MGVRRPTREWMRRGRSTRSCRWNVRSCRNHPILPEETTPSPASTSTASPSPSTSARTAVDLHHLPALSSTSAATGLVVDLRSHATINITEVDIWSYGCLLLELLTLQIPYQGHSEEELYDLLQKQKRPKLTPELETLAMAEESAPASDSKDKILKLLVDLFYECTRGNPADRPTARDVYQKLCAVSPPLDSQTS